MNKLVVHLGPPKTATTSLQYVLKNLSGENFYFGGAYQPRKKTSQGLNKYICEALIKQSDYSIREAIRQIDLAFTKSNTVCISEEMFLVHEDNSTLENKLNVLKQILKKYSCRLLLTVRNPEHTIPAYYQEIYNFLPDNFKKDYKSFLKSNFINAYNYKWINEILNKNDLFELVFLDYQKLINNEYVLSEILGISLAIDEKIVLPKKNISKKKGKKRIVEEADAVNKLIDCLIAQKSKIGLLPSLGIGNIITSTKKKFIKRKEFSAQVPVPSEIFDAFSMAKSQSL